MHHPTIHDVEIIVRKLNEHYKTNVTIINRGQLEFALEKPKIEVAGKEQYEKLHQKLAVLMETLTKSHTLSDGNKRCALMVAKFMAQINDADLILPLKTIRFAVDTAMDESDKMTKVIERWFKARSSLDNDRLIIMNKERLDEYVIIGTLMRRGEHAKADELLDKWMAFDRHPEHKAEWKQILDEWKKDALELAKKHTIKIEDAPLGHTLKDSRLQDKRVDARVKTQAEERRRFHASRNERRAGPTK